MTKEQLNELEALMKMATAGPWEAYSASCCPDMGGVTSEKGRIAQACVARYGHPMTIEDAEFIAAARTAVPALIDRVRRLELELSGYKSDFEKARAAGVTYSAIRDALGDLEQEEISFGRLVDIVRAAVVAGIRDGT